MCAEHASCSDVAAGCLLDAAEPSLRLPGFCPTQSASGHLSQQIPTDANFHSTSFSEADQQRVLITGWVFLSPAFVASLFSLCVAVYSIFGMSNIPPGNMYSSETPYLLLASSRIVQIPGAYFVAVDRAWFPCPNLLSSEERTWEPGDEKLLWAMVPLPCSRSKVCGQNVDSGV